jgi:hypothetical protein
MATTRTVCHDDPTAAAWELRTAASAFPRSCQKSHVCYPVLLGWSALLLGGSALWGLAALGLGRLTGWW